jgi:hypothetical protein
MKRIDYLMASIIASRMVNRVYDLVRVKPKSVKLVFASTPLTRNYDNVSGWNDFSTRGLLFQWANKADIIIIALHVTCSRHDMAKKKCIVHFGVKQQSLTLALNIEKKKNHISLSSLRLKLYWNDGYICKGSSRSNALVEAKSELCHLK